jgi:hypothetical protein
MPTMTIWKLASPDGAQPAENPAENTVLELQGVFST